MCGWQAERTSCGCSKEAGGPGTRGRCAVPLHAAEHTPMRKKIRMTGDDTQGVVGKKNWSTWCRCPIVVAQWIHHTSSVL